MTVSFELPPDVKSRLEAQAAARGLKLEAYLHLILQRHSAESAATWSSADEKARAFEAWAKGHPQTPLLSDDAISREQLTRDAR